MKTLECELRNTMPHFYYKQRANCLLAIFNTCCKEQARYLLWLYDCHKSKVRVLRRWWSVDSIVSFIWTPVRIVTGKSSYSFVHSKIEAISRQMKIEEERFHLPSATRENLKHIFKEWEADMHRVELDKVCIEDEITPELIDKLQSIAHA